MKMTTKEYLQQPYYFDKLIKYKLEEIEKLENMIIYKSPQFKESVSGGEAVPPDERLSKLVELKNELEKEINEMLQIKQDISSLINKIVENNYRTMLTLRYLNYKSFEEIAVIMGYSYRYCIKLHKKALLQIEKNEKNQKEVTKVPKR